MKNPMTFAAFRRQIKKLFALWLVLAIVAGLAVMGVHFITLEDRSAAYAVVNFGFDGIQLGKNPNGGWFDVGEMKSADIIAAGAEAAGMTLAEGEADKIASHISITARVPETVIPQMTNLTSPFKKDTLSVTSVQKVNDYYPTRYMMWFSFGDLGWSRETGNKLLQGMLDAYRAKFNSKYGYNTKLDDRVRNTDYSAFDYTNALTVMKSNLNLLIRYADALAAEDGTGFRSSVTGVTFQDLSAGLQVLLDQDISTLSSYITGHQVSRDLAQLKREYQYKIEEETRSVQGLEERIAGLTDLINKYTKTKGIVLGTSAGSAASAGGAAADGTEAANAQPQTATASGAVEITQPSEVYDSLIRKRIGLQTEMAETKALISQYETLLNSMTGETVEADRVYVEEEMAGLTSRIQEMTESLRQTAEDYFATKKLSDAFTVLEFSAASAFPLKKLIIASAMDAIGVEALLLGIFILLAIHRAGREEKRKNQADTPLAGETV